jgi:hypothetical protein
MAPVRGGVLSSFSCDEFLFHLLPQKIKKQSPQNCNSLYEEDDNIKMLCWRIQLEELGLGSWKGLCHPHCKVTQICDICKKLQIGVLKHYHAFGMNLKHPYPQATMALVSPVS